MLEGPQCGSVCAVQKWLEIRMGVAAGIRLGLTGLLRCANEG